MSSVSQRGAVSSKLSAVQIRAIKRGFQITHDRDMTLDDLRSMTHGESKKYIAAAERQFKASNPVTKPLPTPDKPRFKETAWKYVSSALLLLFMLGSVSSGARYAVTAFESQAASNSTPNQPASSSTETAKEPISTPAATAPLPPPTRLIGPVPEPEPEPIPDYEVEDEDCDPNYSGGCVPNVSYDLDCPDISFSVEVVGSDSHGFDRDQDGLGCESN